MTFWLSLLPILLLLGLVVVAKRSVLFSASVTVLTAAAIAFFYWGVPPELLAGSSIRGILLALEIGLIIASALLIVEILERQKLFHPLQLMLERLSGDYRVQTLLIGMALVSFMEGMAGFGTPMIVALPILVALGMKSLHAVTITLIAATIPGVFGGIGLPITYGIQSVIEGLTSSSGELMTSLVHLAALWYIPATMILALTLVGVIIWLKRGSFRSFIEIIPFTIVASLAISVPAYFTAIFIGPELPTAIGGLSGLILISLMAHRHFLTPRTVIRHDQQLVSLNGEKAMQASEIIKIIWPYLLLILLLIISRLSVFNLTELLQRWQIGFTNIFSTPVSYSFYPLYSAPALLAVVALTTLIVFRLQGYRQSQEVLKAVFKRIKRPLLALTMVLVFVQIFIFSSGTHITETMPTVIAKGLAAVSGDFWPLVAPFVGAIGAGVAGSTTMSNLIFSGLQYDIAATLQMSIVGVLLLQLFGAALGNMIALHNIIAALAVADIPETESHRIIKSNGKILIILAAIAGILGFVVLAFSY